MSASPTISLIMPAYNVATTLRESVQSLLGQTYSDWEAIIFDDGSKDATLTMLRELERNDSRIRVFTQSNQRQAAARNAGIALARGRYVAFLDADDFALPNRFEKQVAFLEKHQEVTVLGSGRINFDAIAGTVLGTFLHPEKHEVLCAHIFTQCPFSTSSVMARAEFFQRRRFDPTMPPCEDHDLWIRSYRDPGVCYHNLQEPLIHYSCRRRLPWSHSRQMSRMYHRALLAEGRWPTDAWYALRPWIAAVGFNLLNRRK